MEKVQVALTSGKVEGYKTVRIKTSGWIVCYDDSIEDKVAYPPRRVDSVKDSAPGDRNRGEGIKTECPHGRI